MQPMPRKKRRFYFYLFSVIFVFVLPVVILYTSGYRFGGDHGIVETGGIYVSAPLSDASVRIGDIAEKKTGVFQKSFFVQDLAPGAYAVSVRKEGYVPWEKDVHVYERKVSRAISFLVPSAPPVLLPRTIDVAGKFGATSTAPNPDFAKAETLFRERREHEASEDKEEKRKEEERAKKETARDGKNARIPYDDTRGRVGIRAEGSNLYAAWLGSAQSAPAYFCMDNFSPLWRERGCEAPEAETAAENPGAADEKSAARGAEADAKDAAANEKKETRAVETLVYAFPGEIRRALFYRGRGDVVAAAGGGIVAIAEIDKRGGQNAVIVYRGDAPDILADGDTLYIRDGEDYYALPW